MKAAQSVAMRSAWRRVRRVSRLWAALAPLALAASASAQLPSVLYTWDGTGAPEPNVENWIRAFGAANTSGTVDNNTPGQLRFVETSAAAGGAQAFAEGYNRIRESSTVAFGGLDLTGLDFLEFDLGHNGTGPIDVQFFAQARQDPLGNQFLSLGPDIPVLPGMNTYKVPLSGLSPDHLVYIRAFGINARDHTAQGNLTWTLNEVRSSGTPLRVRDLITHDTGTAEGGLQGAFVNFDNGAVQGNDGQNQVGLSHNPAGSGSLKWTDVGGSQGAAITWGNGTGWFGNTFNNRSTDLSGYEEMILRISATDPLNGGGTLGMNAFFQKNNFAHENVEGGAGRSIPIDGQFHEVRWSLAGLSNMNVVDVTGVNLFSHPQNLDINVDRIRFRKVTFTAHTLFSWETPDNAGTPGVNEQFEGWVTTNEVPSPPMGVTLDPGHAQAIVSTFASEGTKSYQITRDRTEAFVWGSQFGLSGAGNPTAQAKINELVGLFNRADSIAMDVRIDAQATGFIPGVGGLFLHVADGTGAFYQAQMGTLDFDHVAAGQTLKLVVPLSAFVDQAEGSTKNLFDDGLLVGTQLFEMGIATDFNDGAVFQIDNIRLLTELRADFDADIDVDAADLAAWTADFGAGTGGDSDVDFDSDGQDFLTWQREYGLGPISATAAATQAPEPASWALMAMIGLIAGRRGWRLAAR